MDKHQNLETIAVHAGSSPDLSTGAVTSPIYLSSTFVRNAEGGYTSGFQYSRGNNPNRQALEQCLAALEGGADAAAFASGNAAASAVFHSLATGDHVIVADDMYHGIAHQLREIYIPWGLQVSFVDMTQLEHVQAAVKPNTKMIWIETPSNPLLKITDIAAISQIAHAANALLVCDNTFATPVGQQPLKLGADLVMHSTTKYLSGHSDVIGGVIIAKQVNGLFERIREVQKAGGAVPSPFDCFLTLRGIKTLPYRMRAHAENANKIALFLSIHPAVEAVYYPGLPAHPNHGLATSQMKLSGGMISFLVDKGEEKAQQVANSTKLFTQATSLGGVESLIEHRYSVEGPQSTTPKNLIRISVGLEHPDDLINDLKQALKA